MGGGWQADMKTEGEEGNCSWELPRGGPGYDTVTLAQTTACSNLEKRKKAPGDLAGLAAGIFRQNSESAKQALLTACDVL